MLKSVKLWELSNLYGKSEYIVWFWEDQNRIFIYPSENKDKRASINSTIFQSVLYSLIVGRYWQNRCWNWRKNSWHSLPEKLILACQKVFSIRKRILCSEKSRNFIDWTFFKWNWFLFDCSWWRKNHWFIINQNTIPTS